MPIIAKQARFGFGRETIHNSWVVPAYWLLAREGMEITPKFTEMETQLLQASRESHIEQRVQSTRDWTAKAVTCMAQEGPAFGVLLAELFGKVVTTATGAGNYEHTFESNPGQFPGLSLCRHIEGQHQINASGGRVSDIHIDCGVDKFLTADLGFEGGSFVHAQATASPSVVSPITYFPFKAGSITLDFGGGATSIEIESMDLDIKNILANAPEVRFRIGSGEQIALDQTGIEFKGKIKRRMELDGVVNIYQTIFHELYDMHTPSSFVVAFVGDQIGVTGEPYLFQASMRVLFEDPKLSQSGGVQVEEVPFTALSEGTGALLACSIMLRDSNAEPLTATGTY